MGRNVGANLRVCPTNDETVTLDISHLPAGVYVLKAAGQTVKVVKK